MPDPTLTLRARQLVEAATPGDLTAEWMRALIAEVERLERDASNHRAALNQRDKDWDALVTLIAKTVGDEDDREAAEMAEMAEMEEFDPWHALRSFTAHRDSLAAKLAECEAERDGLCDALRRDWPNVRAETEGEIAAWLETCARCSARTCAEMAADIRNGAWRSK